MSVRVCTCASFNMPLAMDPGIAVYVCVWLCSFIIPLQEDCWEGLLINGINTGVLIHSLAFCLRYTEVFTTVSN